MDRTSEIEEESVLQSLHLFALIASGCHMKPIRTSGRVLQYEAMLYCSVLIATLERKSTDRKDWLPKETEDIGSDQNCDQESKIQDI